MARWDATSGSKAMARHSRHRATRSCSDDKPVERGESVRRCCCWSRGTFLSRVETYVPRRPTRVNEVQTALAIWNRERGKLCTQHNLRRWRESQTAQADPITWCREGDFGFVTIAGPPLCGGLMAANSALAFPCRRRGPACSCEQRPGLRALWEAPHRPRGGIDQRRPHRLRAWHRSADALASLLQSLAAPFGVTLPATGGLLSRRSGGTVGRTDAKATARPGGATDLLEGSARSGRGRGRVTKPHKISTRFVSFSVEQDTSTYLFRSPRGMERRVPR